MERKGLQLFSTRRNLLLRLLHCLRSRLVFKFTFILRLRLYLREWSRRVNKIVSGAQSA